MRGFWVRVWLYLAALTTGASFCILFSGETPDGFASSSPMLGLGAFGVMLGAALVAVIVGSAGRFRFVLIFPAAAVYSLLAVYGRIPFFSLSGWRRLFLQVGEDAFAGANTMYAEPIPYDLIPGLMILLIPIVMIVVTFATSATLYEDSPMFSVAVLGVTIGVLSTISFEDGAGPFFVVFLISIVALLLAAGSSTVDSEPEGMGSRLAWQSVAAGVVVAVVVLLLPQGPFSDQALSEGAIDWTRIGTGSTSNLDVQADVGDYLTVGQDSPIMRVESPERLLWRGGTLDRFDGVRWEDTTGPGYDYGNEIAPEVETRTVTQTVEVLDARTDLLFGGYRITDVDTEPGAPTVVKSSDSSWRSQGELEKGDMYRVISEIPQPTADQLRSAGGEYPVGVQDKFLQIPENNPEAVADTARTIRNRYESPTNYDKARNIERYLRIDGRFTYNLDVNYRRADKAIEEFLAGNKEGFCTQFATSMALLAREEGIPSRVVYGATTGEEVERGEYLVTGGNMHTWVELYFPGVGWYPFDPTPGFSVPSTMEQNAPSPQAPQADGRFGAETPGLTQRQAAAQQRNNAQDQKDSQDEQQKDPSPANRENGPPLWPLYVLLPVLLIAAVPLAKKALASRGRPEDLYRDLTGRLRDLPPPGKSAVADSPALTPNERMLLLAGAAGVDDEAPFREFGRAYTDYLYSGESGRAGGRHVTSSYRRSVRVLGELPLWRRVLGAVNPASLVARMRRSAVTLAGGVRKRLRRR